MNAQPTPKHTTVRLLLVVDNFERHGTQGQLVQLANALEEDERFHLYVGCLKLEGGLLEELRVPEDRTLEFPLRKFYGPDGIRQILRLRRFVRRHRIAVVHSQDFYANMLSLGACVWRSRPKLIVSRRYEILSNRKVHRLGEKVSYRLASAIVTNSPVEKKRLQREFGVPVDRIHFIPNGVDLDRYSPARAARMTKRNEERSGPTVGAVARLEPEKGHDVIIRMIPRLVQEWPNLTVILVGDGSQRPELETSIRELGIERNVILAGEQSDVVPWIGTFDVALLTPHWGEGLPNALLEYLAAGRPVVATRVGAIPDLVREGREGLLVDRGDPDGLAESVATLLRDDQRREEMGQAARSRAEGFGLDRMIQTSGNLYLNMVRRSPNQSANETPSWMGG